VVVVVADSAAVAAAPEEEGQVAAGKSNKTKESPIVHAIEAAEAGTTGEIQVHLTKRWVEKDAFSRAQKLFHQFGMTRTTNRNAVLLYVNFRKHKFAIIGDEGIHKVVGQHYWEELAKHLQQDLRSTHAENAIAMAVMTIGQTLKKYFPADLDAHNSNELPDHVSED